MDEMIIVSSAKKTEGGVVPTPEDLNGSNLTKPGSRGIPINIDYRSGRVYIGGKWEDITPG
jgi:hypothetical protein